MERTGGKDGPITSLRAGTHLRSGVILCAIVLTGCHGPSLRDASFPLDTHLARVAFLPGVEAPGDPQASLARADADLAAAMQWEADGLEGCVDLYYRAAIRCWEHLESWNIEAAAPRSRTAWQIYRESLTRLIASGSRYGRLDPRGQLVVAGSRGRHVVPIAYYGFAWQPSEFCELSPAGDFQRHDIARHYRAEGLGVALIATRQSCGAEPYYPPRQYFPVTAILRRPPSAQSHADDRTVFTPANREAVLEFYNPRLFDCVQVGPALVGMEKDLTAPYARLVRDAPRRFAEGFLDPDDDQVKPELLVMEPYQRGKIPVVFIHGLWSDPLTWVDAINDLRAQGDIYRNYQFWCFRYPTGRELLESAAELRENLVLARESFDPAHDDGAMDRMVLVGHSMGGLVARLEVTYSHDILWQHAARRPLESVRAAPAARERLRRALYFDPSPQVSRVVFIGTPHRGAASASRCIGRFASSLVRISGPEKALHRQLMDDNRDVFAEYIQASWPTCVDLLEPAHPFLQALERMPYNRRVRLHTIIGTGALLPGAEPGDGVVPVSSARHAGVCSELVVPVRHGQLHRDAAGVGELIRILREHAAEPGS